MSASSGVDLGDYAGCPVVVGMEAGALGFAGGADLAEEGLGALGVLGPDRPVAGMVGGLRASCRVAYSDQRLIRVGGAGQLEAEGAGRVGELAVVRRAEVEHLGALGQQVEHVPVAALRFRGCVLV